MSLNVFSEGDSLIRRASEEINWRGEIFNSARLKVWRIIPFHSSVIIQAEYNTGLTPGIY